jgi:hypothetical protein
MRSEAVNYQQWTPITEAPERGDLNDLLAINTGGYIFAGRIYKYPSGRIYVVAPFGRVYNDVDHWSYSRDEPEEEVLMVKPFGIFCAHWWNELGAILNIIQEHKVRSFFELGTLDGGMTALMLCEIRFGTLDRYRGFNLGLQHIDPRVNIVMAKTANNGNWAATKPAALFDVDLWNPETVEMIRREIADADWPGKIFLYCDGGDKIREAHLYWPLLRPGDLLGVHDYSDDPAAIGPEVYKADVADIIGAGRRRGEEALKRTRILLIEKP